MTLLSSTAQIGWPKKWVINNDSCVCYSFTQVRVYNKVSYERDAYKKAIDSLQLAIIKYEIATGLVTDAKKGFDLALAQKDTAMAAQKDITNEYIDQRDYWKKEAKKNETKAWVIGGTLGGVLLATLITFLVVK